MEHSVKHEDKMTTILLCSGIKRIIAAVVVYLQ